jgi:CRP/FNR family cyclic AMP-dependent transcriptional regulator
MVPVSKLSTSEIFQRASKAALERLAAAMEARNFASGETICQEGKAGTALFLISSGSVAVLKKIDSTGTESKKVSELGRDEIFGEMAFLEQAPYSATVVAQENSEILILPRTELEALMKQDPAAVLDQVLTLFSGLSTRLRRTTNEMVTLFEVARVIGQNPSVEELSRQVVRLVQPLLGSEASFGFYLWNLFNDEYTAVWSEGKSWQDFPLIIDAKSPLADMPAGVRSVPDISADAPVRMLLKTTQGHAILASMKHLDQREGFLICTSEKPQAFTRSHVQLLETTAAVLAPALATLRIKEEEKARLLYERNREGKIHHG